jgi:hypothetical protein
VRTRGLGQREGLADERADLPARHIGEDLAGKLGALAGPDLKVPKAGDRDIPSEGVARVDHGKRAAWRSVGGEAAAVGEDPVGVVAELAADAVEHDGGTGPTGCVQNCGRPARLAVVDHHVSPGLAHGVPLGLAASGADDLRPAGSQQLDQENAHAAGRAKHEDLLAGAGVDQPDDAKRGRAVVHDRHGVPRIQAVGHHDRVLEAGGRLPGVAAGAAGSPGVGYHRPPQPAVVHAVADTGHPPGDPVPRHVGRPDREETRAASRADHGVDEHHVAGGDRDDQSAGTRDGRGRLGRDENFRPAEAGHRDGEHALRPRAAGRRRPPRRATAGRAVRDRRCRR